WLERQEVSVKGASAPGFSLGFDYRPDATPTHRTMTFGFGGTGESTETAYTYDGQRRLTSASVSAGRPGSETIRSYDANGNIWKVEQDGTAFGFTLEAGSDRLASADLGGVATT